MSRRIMLNGTSYFGQGAIQEIVNEIKNRHFKKVLVTSTPDLFEFKGSYEGYDCLMQQALLTMYMTILSRIQPLKM